MEKEELIEALRNQAQLYDLLRRAFIYPLTVETLIGLSSLEVADADNISPLAEGVYLLHQRLKGKDLNTLIEELNQEYTRLFIGPGPTIVPPYASCFLASETRLFGEETLRVRKAYLAAGLAPAQAGMPDDHIALELEFMYFLAQHALQSLEGGDKESCQRYLTLQESFLQQHLRPWIPAFCADILEATEEPFFRGLALITNDLLTEE